MANKRAPGHSLDEWMELVTECRQSGLSDAAWCHEHGISPSCFIENRSNIFPKLSTLFFHFRVVTYVDFGKHKESLSTYVKCTFGRDRL